MSCVSDISQAPQEVRCMRNYVRPSVPPFTEDYLDPSQYPHYSQCAEEIRDWSISAGLTAESTNYYENRTHANKTSECQCNTLQEQSKSTQMHQTVDR